MTVFNRHHTYTLHCHIFVKQNQIIPKRSHTFSYKFWLLRTEVPNAVFFTKLLFCMLSKCWSLSVIIIKSVFLLVTNWQGIELNVKYKCISSISHIIVKTDWCDMWPFIIHITLSPFSFNCIFRIQASLFLLWWRAVFDTSICMVSSSSFSLACTLLF